MCFSPHCDTHALQGGEGRGETGHATVKSAQITLGPLRVEGSETTVVGKLRIKIGESLVSR